MLIREHSLFFCRTRCSGEGSKKIIGFPEHITSRSLSCSKKGCKQFVESNSTPCELKNGVLFPLPGLSELTPVPRVVTNRVVVVAKKVTSARWATSRPRRSWPLARRGEDGRNRKENGENGLHKRVFTECPTMFGRVSFCFSCGASFTGGKNPSEVGDGKYVGWDRSNSRLSSESGPCHLCPLIRFFVVSSGGSGP